MQKQNAPNSLSYHVDLDGRIAKIEGFAGLLDKWRASVSPEVVAAMEPLLNEQVMLARETAEWNGRFGDFAGASFEIGETLESTVPFVLPNGDSITYQIVTVIQGWESCPAGMCVRIRQIYASDADTLGKLVSEVVEGAVGSLTDEPPPQFQWAPPPSPVRSIGLSTQTRCSSIQKLRRES